MLFLGIQFSSISPSLFSTACDIASRNSGGGGGHNVPPCTNMYTALRILVSFPPEFK